MSQQTRLRLSELLLAIVSMLFGVSAWGVVEKFHATDEKIDKNYEILSDRVMENREAMINGTEKYERLLVGQSAILAEIKNIKERQNGYNK